MTNIIEKLRDVSLDELAANEKLKVGADYLRGRLMESMADRATGAVVEDDTQLTKFHGFYMQDDRDVRNERRQQKLEPLYSFMVRLRMPGGVMTSDQWLKLDDVAQKYANGTLRITTRQTFQYHGVFKDNLRAHLKAVNEAMLDTIAACGDVNRNVISTANPHVSSIHRQVYELAGDISAHLLPSTRAYHEIFLGEERVAGGPEEQEPLYTKHYLPRKFKIALTIPPENDVDVFAHDLGFIAHVENGELKGFNVSVGGGMGMTHGEPSTYPRTGDVIGYCPVDQVIDVSEKVMLVQRDNGDRRNRKHARMKYTVDDHGPEWFRAELESYLGYALEEPREFQFDNNGDRYGWYQGENGQWHYGMYVENGRIADFVETNRQLMTGMREIAKIHDNDIVLTTNQNLIITNVAEDKRAVIDALIEQYNMVRTTTPLRRQSMACVAFPTCGLAMAESERYMPSLLDKLDAVMADAGLSDDAIVVRMTGCPNGCARPYLAEIGFVGKALGRYNLYLGGNFTGQRLNKLYRENIDEATILGELTPLIHRYAKEREEGEYFGDFVIRAGVIKETTAGRNFHEQ
ncbi:NADPH-dependent assimilatory sulfite reductase hemoprotein subunit [Phytohalomonas tamaricis]|uniref:NADPH-dependent assimilatory sulfite reductase hemoprotein subunit n=1 Tax=Phytohalomonas tamaricis TaxID=2081032 RepID=UPI000D0BC53C|nr:NADPH-dependent assimilatory sulfite reductase hemoprotein subunit [Phytohalomonas tamaricis]